MAHILVVDDEEVIRDLLSQILERRGHTCDLATDGRRGCEFVEQREYDLIVTDIRMPEMGGLDFLRAIEPRVESRTPCMIITALADEPSVAVKAVRLACDFLSKPFDVRTVEQAVERALVLREAWKFRREYERRLEEELRRKESELHATYEGVLIALATMLEGKDADTATHCERVLRYTDALATEMAVEDEKLLRSLRWGAVLHDIGKYRVDSEILLKPGDLTPDEWAEMKKHPVYGAGLLERIPFLAPARDIVLCHHERWDGGGYPRGLVGEAIPLSARIFFVVDTFDAMCEDRCYRDAVSPEDAYDEICRGAGTQFDPAVVTAFERAYPKFLEIHRELSGQGGGDNGRAQARGELTGKPDEVTLSLRRRVAREIRMAMAP